jgi:stringent starvation protein B
MEKPMADLETDNMTSNKPYLVRAFYEWIVDNECTPYVVVDAFYEGSEVPQEFVNDGQIVLNMSPRAITALDMNNEVVYFNTRFSGVSTNIRFPVDAIVGIYARENGQGMIFEPEELPDSTPPSGDEPPTAPRPSGKPSLRVIK